MKQNEIFVVRHGESENNLLKVDCSKLENKDKFGLTELGQKQSESEAKKFHGFDLIVTSPQRRSVETANIFAKYSQCEVSENELLNEIDYGDFELCSYQESDDWFDKNGSDESISFPKGESLRDARNRAAKFLQELSQTFSGKKILVVTHGHIVLFLEELLDEKFNRKKAIDTYDDDQSRKVIEVNRP
jgi:broad specificity phosphatase PhoE